MEFREKVVLIADATSKIGLATAIYFIKKGANLALIGLNINELKNVVKQCDNLIVNDNQGIYYMSGDLTDESDVEFLFASIISNFGRLDILVNNLEIFEQDATNSLEHFDKIFKTNVRSIYQLTTLAVPHLVRSKGNIVNLSLTNNGVSPGHLAYSMSKSCIDQFTKCIALELASKGVRSNSVNLERINSVNYSAKPDEIARTIAFLAGSQAEFITGVNFTV